MARKTRDELLGDFQHRLDLWGPGGGPPLARRGGLRQDVASPDRHVSGQALASYYVGAA